MADNWFVDCGIMGLMGQPGNKGFDVAVALPPHPLPIDQHDIFAS